jgi:hypothetical protein
VWLSVDVHVAVFHVILVECGTAAGFQGLETGLGFGTSTVCHCEVRWLTQLDSIGQLLGITRPVLLQWCTQ